MDLAAMMGLMIEEMHQSRRQGLLDLGRVRDRLVPDASREIGFGKAVDIADDPLVLLPARRTKSGKSSNRIASSRFGASPVPENRFSQMRSATRRWFRVPCTDLKNAPRSAR